MGVHKIICILDTLCENFISWEDIVRLTFFCCMNAISLLFFVARSKKNLENVTKDEEKARLSLGKIKEMDNKI